MKRLLVRIPSSIVYRTIKNTICGGIVVASHRATQKAKTPVLSHWGRDSVVAQGRIDWPRMLNPNVTMFYLLVEQHFCF